MSKVLDQWEAATNFGNSSQPNETHICGDINIDMYRDRWLQPDYSLINLSRILKTTCDTNNFSQLVKEVTRVQYNSVLGKSSISCLDHFIQMQSTDALPHRSTPSVTLIMMQ